MNGLPAARNRLLAHCGQISSGRMTLERLGAQAALEWFLCR
jgi:hypothetical protein